MKSLSEVLSSSTSYLKQKGIANPRRQAEEILCDALGLHRLQLYTEFDRPLTNEEISLCEKRLDRRAKGEPLQYIHGSVDFYHCQIQVSSSVLIPRQETEILIDKIVQELQIRNLKDRTLWDICCGSGCLGIALKKRFPELNVILSDISLDALQIARRNALCNEVNVQLVQGDLLDAFIGQKVDYMICNPPYLSEEEYDNLDAEVRDYEPKLALVAGQKGTEYYERLAEGLRDYLHPQALVWLELGYRQGRAVEEIFRKRGWKQMRLEKDWAGHDRFFFLENE